VETLLESVSFPFGMDSVISFCENSKASSTEIVLGRSLHRTSISMRILVVIISRLKIAASVKEDFTFVSGQFQFSKRQSHCIYETEFRKNLFGLFGMILIL
jgi:hypothetical protein